MTQAELTDMFNILDELTERMVRIETRLVKLMLAQGVIPHSEVKGDETRAEG